MSNSVGPEDPLRKQAWDYFQTHAGQRLTTFNFYLTLSTAVTTALFLTFQERYRSPFVGIILSLLLVFFSLVFYQLDNRNRTLIKLAEDALKFFEGESGLPDEGGKPHRAKVFTREESVTQEARRGQSRRPWERHYSYADCFRGVIWAFGSIGLFGLVLSSYFALAPCL